MEGHTFLSWNIPNFVTVVLMGAVGLFIANTVVKLYQQRQNG